MGEETGYVFGDHSSDLTNVGCEACHSPSGPHDNEPNDAKESCVGCHDEKHSIAFSYEKGLPHIDHFISNTMTEDQLRERVQSIADGTAAKPLLALPKGNNVGSEACIGCHKDVHPKDPHTKAFETLKKEERERTACLRCHATAKKLPAQSVEDYHTEEGVGCESCHGPGESHVAKPSNDNIIRLGESCSECVLEALCTSCHTKEWDPKWELHERLKIYR